jgi:hypothetical protein
MTVLGLSGIWDSRSPALDGEARVEAAVAFRKAEKVNDRT